MNTNHNAAIARAHKYETQGLYAIAYDGVSAYYAVETRYTGQREWCKSPANQWERTVYMPVPKGMRGIPR